MDTQIKPDYYIKNIDGSFIVVHGCDIERGKVEVLEEQLAEARAENELLKLLSISNKTYQCNYCGKSQCIVAPLNKEEIRQEAARECLEIIQFVPTSAEVTTVDLIKQRFKLEG